METARVIGTVVATTKVEALRGQRLLWLEVLDEHGKPRGARVVAVDVTRSGEGSLVFFVRAREAAAALDDPSTPVDAAVVGLVHESRLAADRTAGE